MNSERWERIQLLLEGALAKPGELRSAFIESACGNDVELRDEVVSLLGASDRSPEKPEPPTEWWSSLAGPKPPRFTAGEHLAHRYRIERLLGRGGMGEVYEAWDEELSIPVALKALHLPGGNEEAHKRLKLEGILARSVWHPNVCRLYDLGRHGKGEGATWFLTMELLRGETLSKLLHDVGRLPLDRAQRFAEQMAAGLGAAHQAGVVHRDFKTNNIMLVAKDGGEQAVVTDFGIARGASNRGWAAENQGGLSGPIIGTPTYMAPEQVRGEEVGPAADIYALGIVLYEMVTGTVPFTGDSAIEVARRRLEVEPLSPRHVVPDLDERWEAVILRCLAREQRQRFGRAEEVADALAGRMFVDRAEPLDLTAGTRHTLPAEGDSFVGREMESEDLARNLGGSRLVTLIGAGGMGKTRLAVRYGRQTLRDWPGGVWFCDLTEARTLQGIASAVAGSLEVQLGRGDPIEQLGHAIAGRGRCLMILDNFEQVVDHTSASVGRWLARATEARFLITSREKLSLVDQEKVQEVGPLSIEAGLELFVARTQRLRPGLEIVGSEAEAAREIVRLVEAMPLAIELAGARMRVMSAAQIVSQMSRRFSLLTGGGSARHETLVMAIDGSWELLKPWERSAWAQCAVFESGFTLEAAEGVIDLRAWPDAPWVVDVVQSLVDKSLLRTWVPARGTGEEVPEARFGMFVSLQEYAREKLRKKGAIPEGGSGAEAERAAEQRHGRWYARYGKDEAMEALEWGAERQRAVLRELENLVAACRRATARGNGQTAAAAYRAVWAVLLLRGPYGAAIELGHDVVRMQLGREEQALVLNALGQAELLSGRMEEAENHLEKARVLHHATGNRHSEVIVLVDQGHLYQKQGRIEEARTRYQAALDFHREVGNKRLEGIVLYALGNLYYQYLGRMEEALTCYEAALVLNRKVGNRRYEGAVLGSLANLHLKQGRVGEARLHYEAALQILRLVGDRRQEGFVLQHMGNLHLTQGRMQEARAHYEAAVAIHRELGIRQVPLTNLGTIDLEQGRLEEARVHLEAALGLHREGGDRRAEGIDLAWLGILHQEQGRMEEARTHYEAALAIHREVGNRHDEGFVRVKLGGLHRVHGRMEEARAHDDAALAIVRETGNRFEEGTFLGEIGALYSELGKMEEARDALARGEALLRELEAPLELGKLLCIRAQLEHRGGDAAAARHTLDEVEALAALVEAGPHSKLGRELARLRQTLAAE